MRLYTTPFTGDELMTDGYPSKPDPDNGCIRFTGRYMEFIDEDDETKTPQSVIDVVKNFELQKFPMKKAALGGWAKTFMPKRKKQLEEQHPELVADFMADAKKFVNFISKEWEKVDIYMGQSGDPDDLLIFCIHDESGEVPYFYLLASAANNCKV
jgi:hypothetical protein